MTAPQASPFILNLDSPGATLEQVGGKGASLARMAVAGLPVPPGFHITTDAYRRFVEENHLGDGILAAMAQAQANDPASLERASEQIQSLIAKGIIPGDIAEAIRKRYDELGADLAVAVRSSATAEDLPDMSFAGQLETYLNVRGGDEVLDAVRRCWASLWTGRVIGYRQRQGILPDGISMAVVVQQLVAAEAAGVAFTANPVTGARDEMMINAAWGLGEAIVGGRVTPDTMVVDKQTGATLSEEIASKDVMTVRLAMGTREEPVPAAKRNKAALKPEQVAELARLGVKIEQLYGQPMDIEWAMCDGQIFILQARPVTALPEARVTLDWTPPRKACKYYRQSVAELLPEPLSPLFATLALPLWTEASREIMEQVGVARMSFCLVTIHDYMYYELALNARQTARMVFGMIFRAGRMVRMLRTAPEQWANGALPRYEKVVGEWAARDLRTTPALALLAGARQIVKAAADNYLTIQMVLASANGGEAGLPVVYNRLIKRKSDPPALTFVLGFDSEPIRAEKSLYDLANWARRQDELCAYLAQAGGKEIWAACESHSPPIAHAETWREFTARLTDHVNRFGHAVYDLDFAKSVPAEDPASLIENVKYFMAGQGRDPYQRQAAATAAREQAAAQVLARPRGLRLRLFQWVLAWAQRMAPMREDALASVGVGWPVLRRMLREVGRRMAAAGAIADRDEVFWLKCEELESAARSLDAGEALVQDHRQAIAERRQTWRQERGVTPPVALPLKGGARFLGIDFSGIMPAKSGQAQGSTIKGFAASPGKASGTACVVQGPEEFDRMRPHDILVAKITTPAWTPLFTLASGIVTDVGGPLSHSSIVAREYGLPAVLGTGVATERIHGGQRITVDGDIGLVTLEK